MHGHVHVQNFVTISSLIVTITTVSYKYSLLYKNTSVPASLGWRVMLHAVVHCKLYGFLLTCTWHATHVSACPRRLTLYFGPVWEKLVKIHSTGKKLVEPKTSETQRRAIREVRLRFILQWRHVSIQIIYVCT